MGPTSDVAPFPLLSLLFSSPPSFQKSLLSSSFLFLSHPSGSGSGSLLLLRRRRSSSLSQLPYGRTAASSPDFFFSFPRRACTLFSSILFRLCFFGRFFFWLFLVDPGEGGGREARFELLLLMASMPQLEVKISSYIARLLFFFFFWPCATADREFDDDLCGHLLNFADFICKNIFFLDRSIIIA